MKLFGVKINLTRERRVGYQELVNVVSEHEDKLSTLVTTINRIERKVYRDEKRPGNGDGVDQALEAKPTVDYEVRAGAPPPPGWV